MQQLIRMSLLATTLVLSACDSGLIKTQNDDSAPQTIQLGARPYFLLDQLQNKELKGKLMACGNGPFYKTEFSIGHRGAPLQFPEHTKESYQSAARMGAGILECDVTFTQDQVLVCRHSQCDLHTTTNILAIPELAAKCSVPFSPANPETGKPAQAKCCTSDITLAEFKSLKGKMDGFDPTAQTVEQYMRGTAPWRTDLYAGSGTLMTHKESIELFKVLAVKMTPELKAADVEMPFNGFTQQDYAQKMLDEYKQAGVSASQVFPQSFNLADIQYWLEHDPDFAKQGVYLDGRFVNPEFNPQDAGSWSPSMEQLVADGVQIIAPPVWMLVTSEKNKIVPSAYAEAANAAGLKIIGWTLERSGPLVNGGGWYYQSIADITDNDGVQLELLDVLAQQVGVIGVFSDWPATTTYYANCMGL